MDPIYYQVNQTRLTENTQKSSDNLRLQSNKEAKRKAERAGDVDKAALATDSSAMSEDMLGDMDPDDTGGSGAKQFAQMWREQQEEQRRRDEHPEEEEEEADQADGDPGEAEEADWEEMVEGQWVELESTPQANSISDPPLEVPPSAPVAVPTGTAEVAASVAEVAAAPVAPAPKLAGTSAFSSLLDFGNGYLIAEEAQWAEPEELPEEAAEEVPHVPDELSVLLDRLVTGDSTSPNYRRLQALLARFGRHALQVCSDAEVRVYLLPSGERLHSHPQLSQAAEPDLEGAVYLPGQRLCLVEESCVARAPQGFHPVFFYLAHAFDHALGGEVFASLKSPAVQASYLACVEGAHRFGDLLAAHSPAHYFAQAVESYLAENDCVEPLWTRQDLYDFDRSMYDYIEYLLKMK